MLTRPCNVHPPYIPLLYSKTGVYREIHYFLIFAPKHRFWVLVRIASVRRFLRVPTIFVLSKNKKNVAIFSLKITIFTAFKNRCILHGRVFVMDGGNDDWTKTSSNEPIEQITRSNDAIKYGCTNSPNQIGRYLDATYRR